MKVRNATAAGNDKIELQMTPMIDIVFQLLVFFIMTFKIVAQEGDFQVHMPQDGSPGVSTQVPPLVVRMAADPDGSLTGISLGSRPLGVDFSALQQQVVGIVGTDRGPGSIAENVEVELDCDFNLRYEYVIRAITAVSATQADGATVKLIERIKFARQRPQS